MNRFQHRYLQRVKALLAALLCSFAVHSQTTINYAEYFFDSDPGVGNATQISIASDINDVLVNESITISGLAGGYHQLFLRTRTNTGLWSHYEPQWFKVNPQIVAAEYFVDTDPGVGLGIPFSISPADDSIQVSVNTAALNLKGGWHNLYIRTKNDKGEWGHHDSRPFYIKKKIVAAEFFVDTDPGFGNGTAIGITANEDSVIFNGSITLPYLTPGEHLLYIRTKDMDGEWSHYESKSFMVKSKLVAAEYFIDTDPGFGNGEPISITAADDSILFSGGINLPLLSSGTHYLFIRTQNEDGEWGFYEGRPFVVKSNIVAAEYFIDTDPGVGNGEALSITAGMDSISFNDGIVLPTLPLGVHYLYVRTMNADGEWSLAERRNFTICNDLIEAPEISGNTVFCAGQTLEHLGQTVAGATSYFWKGPGGYTQAGMTLSRAGATAAMSGDYTFYAVRAGGTACDSGFVKVHIVVDPQIAVNNPPQACLPQKVNLTSSSVLSGDLYGATLSYWEDENATVALSNPAAIGVSGTYYIKAEWPSGCERIMPVVAMVITCPPPPVNDQPKSNNPNLNNVSYVYPNCYQVSGTTAGATINAATGLKDVWYQFPAISSGVSIKVSSTAIDAKVFLFDYNDLSTPLDVEDMVQGTGTEILNYNNLVAGQKYRIAIAPADGVEGDFKLCLQQLRLPLCDKTGTMSLCDLFKIKPTGATNINVSFTDDNENTVSQTTSTFVTLSQESLGLKPEWNYSVGLIANYTALVDGLGNPEPIIVPNPEACTITIAPHALVEVKANQRCGTLAVLPRNSYLNASVIGASSVCGANGYKIEFVEMDGCNGQAIALPMEKVILGTLPWVHLTYPFPNVEYSGMTGVGYWKVRWKPRFANGYYGTYGPEQIIAVNGTAQGAGMAFDPSEASNSLTTGENIAVNIYPNPNNGDMVNINVTGINGKDVFVRILDAMGREVYTNRFEAEGSLTTIVSFAKPLASGLYMVEFRNGDKVITQRMMVSK